MKHYLVLESSEFSLRPPGGRLVYKSPSGRRVERELLKGKEVGEGVPYELLNPIQTLFWMEYEGGNALISAPTSAGKSLIAFMFMLRKEGRKVYTAPTKSLVYEKVAELRRLFGRRVDVRTGDIVDLYREVSSDVVVSTYESLALALRNKAQWALEVGSVVVDEIHSLLHSRGSVLEEIITYLLEMGVDILGLSATLPEGIKLAKWMRAGLFVESLWRPVPLERRILPLTEFKDFTRAKSQEERIASKLLCALYELKRPGEQVILFVPKKSVGWEILRMASRERIGVLNETTPFEKEEVGEAEIAFHNADIPREEREEIERAFREGRLPVLVATQTLAYGVNLPADTVIIGVRAFYDRKERRWKTFPSELDILQMEGRAGRLGIKDRGYSYILTYGARPSTVEEELRKRMEGKFEPYLMEKLRDGGVDGELHRVGLFVLIGYLYEGEGFKRFLRRTFSLKDRWKDPLIDEVWEWLKEKGYIERGRLSDKALLCIRSGMYPTNYEEFLRRKLLGLDKLVLVRPLLFVKRFEGLYEFLKEGETFPEDELHIRQKLAPCGGECFSDNTHQFLFYLEGLTFKYPNIHHPPGEFSYLGTDALHLMRLLLDIRELGDISWGNEEIIKVAHSVKYGLTEEFSSLGGIKGVGHVRANLLKRVMVEEGLKPPAIGIEVGEFLEYLYGAVDNLEGKLREVLERDRFRTRSPGVEKEVKQVMARLEGSRGGILVDERVLRTFGLFYLGPEAMRMRKRELAKRLLSL